MVSIPKPGSLLVVCGSARLPINGKSSPKLSPSHTTHGTWKDSLDDLSKELQKICHSPVSNPGSPSLSRTSPVTTPPSSDKSSSPKSQTNEMMFPHFPIPAVLVQNVTSEHTVLRVRHEETRDLLQKRLSMISGFKNSSDSNFIEQRRTSKEMAALASSKKKHQEQYNLSRFRTLVNIGDCPHDELMVICEKNHLSLFQVSNGKQGVEFRRVDIPSTLDLERLICTVQGQSLEIMEYPKKAIFTERTGFPNSDDDNPHYHCPTVVEDVKNNLWKLVWHVPEQFDSSNVSVKTLDEKLVIICRQRTTSGNNNVKLLPTTIQPDGGAPQSPTTHCYMKITIELPENVEPKTVSAIITQKKQLIIQGISSWRARCVTY